MEPGFVLTAVRNQSVHLVPLFPQIKVKLGSIRAEGLKAGFPADCRVLGWRRDGATSSYHLPLTVASKTSIDEEGGRHRWK